MSPVDRHRAGRFGDCYCPGPVRRSLIHSPVCMIRCPDSLPLGVLDYWNTRRRQEASKLPSRRLCEAVAPYTYLKFPSFFIIAYVGNRKARARIAKAGKLHHMMIEHVTASTPWVRTANGSISHEKRYPNESGVIISIIKMSRANSIASISAVRIAR